MKDNAEKDLKAVVPGAMRIFRKFWPHIRKRKFLISGSLFALLVDTVLGLLEPWPLKFVFDRIILPGSNTNSWNVAIPNGMSPVMLLTFLAIAIVAMCINRHSS